MEEITNMTNLELETLLKKYSQHYYNGKSLITDSEWDNLYDYYFKKNPKSIFFNEIGSSPVNNKIKLPIYLGSLDKVKPDNKHFIKFFQPKDIFILSEKLDGVSILLDYKNNKMKAYSRGNGYYGQDVTPTISQIENIPNTKLNKSIMVRGELVIPKKYNTLKNLRNIVSGVVNSKIPDVNVLKECNFIAYSIPNSNDCPREQFQNLENMGFTIPRVESMDSAKIDNISSHLSTKFKNWREESIYDIDGLVISKNISENIIPNNNPKNTVAFKSIQLDQIAKTEVLDIEWNLSKDKIYKPVLILKSVQISNSNINRVTAHNARYLIKKQIGIGSEIELIRSGDVIPKVHKVISISEPHFPISNWEWDKNQTDIISPDADNKDKLLLHFIKKIGGKYINLKTCGKLKESGVDNISKLLSTDNDFLSNINGLNHKSITKILESIRVNLEKCELTSLVVATNCFGSSFGESRIKLIMNSLGNDIVNYTETQIENLDQITGISNLLKEHFNIGVSNLRNYLRDYPLINKYYLDKLNIQPNLSGGKLDNIKICFTGFRDKNLQTHLLDEGAIIKNNITKDLDILIIKNNEQVSKKITKAEELSITILAVDDFKKQYNLN